jgi:hypothetical protein
MSTARGNTRVLRVSDCEGRTRFGHSRKARDASNEIRHAEMTFDELRRGRASRL